MAIQENKATKSNECDVYIKIKAKTPTTKFKKENIF